MLVIFGLTSISIILGTVIRLNDQRTRLFEMFCVTWYHLYNLKNDKKLGVFHTFLTGQMVPDRTMHHHIYLFGQSSYWIYTRESHQ